MTRTAKSHSIRLLATLTIGTALGGAACNSPAKTAQRFCENHRAGELMDAWKMFSSKDQGEIKQRDYADFGWDQETFDLRLLRSHENCTATFEPLNETEALATLTLSTRLHDGTMSCVAPMVKEGEAWKMTRHFVPLESLTSIIASARAQLKKSQAALLPLDGEAWSNGAKSALSSYWDAIDAEQQKVKAMVGEEIPPFCYGALNLDGGRDLAYTYLGFQKPANKKATPKRFVADMQQRQRLIDALRGDYKPLASVVHEGVHVDLLTAAAGDGGAGNVTKDEVRALMLVWGDLKAPLHWTLYVYQGGKLANEGNGTPLDILTDSAKYVSDAPDVKIALFEFPKMPAGTDKLELRLVDDAEKHEFMVPIPVKPEFVEAG